MRNRFGLTGSEWLPHHGKEAVGCLRSRLEDAGGPGRYCPRAGKGRCREGLASATNRLRLTTQAAEGSATTEGHVARRTLMNQHPNCAVRRTHAAEAEVCHG